MVGTIGSNPQFPPRPAAINTETVGEELADKRNDHGDPGSIAALVVCVSPQTLVWVAHRFDRF
jgi:hypothetical protein